MATGTQIEREGKKKVERREDQDLITGHSTFTGDIDEPNALHMAILQSEFAHARLGEIDVSEAGRMEGVVAVFTGDDLRASDAPGIVPRGTAPLDVANAEINHRKELHVPDRPILANEKVRYLGEPIAVVVAHDRYAAYSGVDAIDVEFELLDAIVEPTEVTTTQQGDARPSPLHEDIQDNTGFEWEIGDADRVASVFEEAAHTISIERKRQRILPTSIEPRAAFASYDSGDSLHVRMGTQVPYIHKRVLAEILGLELNEIRIDAPSVGGGFGAKSKYYPEEALTAWTAMQLKRPVKWQATRSEASAADVHGRGHETVGELAIDDDGTFLGMRVRSDKDLGAYVSRAAPIISTGSFATMLSGQYVIPEIYCRVRGVFTNTTPTDAYRGSDRPEATFIVERLIDMAAAELDVDPAELRQQNFIPPERFPYQTPVVSEYDSGRYGEALEIALEEIDYEATRRRQTELREENRFLGIGFGCFIEKAGSPPYSPTDGDPPANPVHAESSRLLFHPSGTVAAFCGTADQGQGHKTSYAQIVADTLGIPEDAVEVREGDTLQLPHGTGSFSSRSIIMAGNSLAVSAQKLIDQATRIVANRFDTTPSAVRFEDGIFHHGDERVDIQSVAQWAYRGVSVPTDMEPGLEATTFYTSDGWTYPYGAHAAIVEVDTDTYEVTVRRYVAVDDVGIRISPTQVDGQIEGGVVAGIGQALIEDVVYDETGTLQTRTLQDYSVPRADDVPFVETYHLETPSPRNPLGVKGAGESGSVGAPAAIVNAVVDALAPFGIEHLDMPVTSEDIWDAIGDGG